MPSLWMLFASFMFAAMGAAVKLASNFFSTSELVMYRGLIGTVILLFVVRQQGGTFRTAFPREHLWRSGVGVTSLWLWFYAIGALPLATAVTLNYMAPIWIAAAVFAIGWWRGEKHAEWPLVLAVGMSFVGVTLVLRPAIETNQWLGGLSGLVSSVISAMAYMQVRRLGQMGDARYHRRALPPVHLAQRRPDTGDRRGGPVRADGDDARLPRRQGAGRGQPAVHRHRVLEPVGHGAVGRPLRLARVAGNRRDSRLRHRRDVLQYEYTQHGARRRGQEDRSDRKRTLRTVCIPH
jgi:hypothetical protein